MSASEKLAALVEQPFAHAAVDVIAALPQIVAVIEAAEEHVESPGALAADKKHSDLRVALTALEEALS